MSVYLTLFLVSFLAATILPAYSELMFAGLLDAGYDPLRLLLWATVGNTLGACVNWVLGRFLLRYQQANWFPFKADKLEHAQRWFQTYGVWSLLLAWAPIVGDALTFVAGVMRVRFWIFVGLTCFGKGARYLLILALFSTL